MSGSDWEDRILGMLAVEQRFISEKQLRQCLNKIEFFDRDKSLGEVLVEKGFLTRVQLQRLKDKLDDSTDVSAGDTPKTNSSKTLFGDIARQQNMVNEEQLLEALSKQEGFVRRGLNVQIGQILSKNGFITRAQVGRILEMQLRKTLHCKRCNTNYQIENYIPSSIYQCSECGLDLLEVTPKKKKPVQLDDIDDGGDDDLEILEL